MGHISARHVLLICLLILLAGAGPGVVSAGPSNSPVHAPEGAAVNALAIDPMTPSTLYAGTTGGLYKSTDGGTNWALITPADYDVLSIAIDPLTPATVYAGTRTAERGGVYKSTDGGASWRYEGLPKWSISVLAVDPVTPAIVYAGGRDISADFSLYRSRSGGASWVQIAANYSGGGSVLFIRDLVIDPKTPTIIYYSEVGDCYHCAETGVYKSPNRGGDWTPTLITRQVGPLAIDPVTPTTIYAGTQDGGGLVKTINGGHNWLDAGPTGYVISTIAIDPLTPATLYAGTPGSGVFKSTDGAGSWAASGLADVDVRTLAIDPVTPTTLYAGANGGGVWKSTDGGRNWILLNGQLDASQ